MASFTSLIIFRIANLNDFSSKFKFWASSRTVSIEYNFFSLWIVHNSYVFACPLISAENWTHPFNVATIEIILPHHQYFFIIAMDFIGFAAVYFFSDFLEAIL